MAAVRISFVSCFGMQVGEFKFDRSENTLLYFWR